MSVVFLKTSRRKMEEEEKNRRLKLEERKRKEEEKLEKQRLKVMVSTQRNSFTSSLL